MSLDPFEFPPVPDRNDRLTFPSRMAAFFTKLAAFPAWAQTVADKCYQNATTTLSLSAIQQEMDTHFAPSFAAKASLDGAAFTGPVTVQGATESGNPVPLGQVSTANAPPVKVALNAGGAAPIYACRAWVCFKGTGTVSIRKSANVSSITDRGEGIYRVNFTTAMEDVNWAGAATPSGGSLGRIVTGHEDVQARALTYWEVVTFNVNDSPKDSEWVNVVIFD